MWGNALGRAAAFDRPARTLFELPQADECYRPRGEHAEQHRVERAEVARVVGRADGRAGVPDNGVHESEVIATEREVLVRPMIERRELRLVGLPRAVYPLKRPCRPVKDRAEARSSSDSTRDSTPAPTPASM